MYMSLRWNYVYYVRVCIRQCVGKAVNVNALSRVGGKAAGSIAAERNVIKVVVVHRRSAGSHTRAVLVNRADNAHRCRMQGARRISQRKSRWRSGR